MGGSLCLALAIWYECRGCIETERVQVAHTIVARKEDGTEFTEQNTICRVVSQPGHFSFKREGVPLAAYVGKAARSTGTEGRAWIEALRLSEEVLAGRKVPTLERTLHFHRADISPPDWSRGKQPKMLPNWQHVFYCPRPRKALTKPPETL